LFLTATLKGFSPPPFAVQRGFPPLFSLSCGEDTFLEALVADVSFVPPTFPCDPLPSCHFLFSHFSFEFRTVLVSLFRFDPLLFQRSRYSSFFSTFSRQGMFLFLSPLFFFGFVSQSKSSFFFQSSSSGTVLLKVMILFPL